MKKQLNDEMSEIIKGGQEFTKQVLTILSQRLTSNYYKSLLKIRLSKEDNKELLDIMAQSLAETEVIVKELIEEFYEGDEKDA